MLIFRYAFLNIMNNCITLLILILMSGMCYTDECAVILFQDKRSVVITANEINNAIKHMKPGKSDGFDGLTTDYFLNGSPLLSEYISCLFTCMLSHCFIPTSFSVSTMVPIPKGVNKDLTNMKPDLGQP